MMPIQHLRRPFATLLLATLAVCAGRPANAQETLRRGSSNEQLIDDELRKAVAEGHQWLAAHQDEDGKWDCDGFMKHDSADSEICDGPGNAVHDVGVTGLALLAFLGDGSTMRAGRSPRMTSRPLSVSTTSGRSSPTKLTKPAVTQRRSTRVNQSLRCSESTPKVETPSSPERSRRGSLSPRSSLTARPIPKRP